MRCGFMIKRLKLTNLSTVEKETVFVKLAEKTENIKKLENTRKNNKPVIHFIIFFLEVDEVRHHF